MNTVDEIVAAAKKLDADEFERLRKKLLRIEKTLWEQELTRVTAEMKKKNLTDEDIDRIVMKRRRENRR